MTIDDAIAELERAPRNVKFSRLTAICGAFFKGPTISGSHHRFKTPWPGDPRINLQADGSQAKIYQVRQVVQALRKLKGGGAE